MTPQDLRQEFNSKYPEYVNIQTYPQVYTEWLEQKLIESNTALSNLLQACDDEGWVDDDGNDWEEQAEARKILNKCKEAL